MPTCDVSVLGGGPAGSTCACALGHAGLEVVVMDAAVFPRDKVCAGWITPQVIAELDLDLDDYRRGRTLQPITAFRTGLLGGYREVETAYDQPVSYGIRRCEFDYYLLQRSRAQLCLGSPIADIERAGDRWMVNDTVSASMLVGAGGHFCPVARLLNRRIDDAPLVVAQETEFEIDRERRSSFRIDPAAPELYFSRDLQGYGWCFRKQEYLNVGFGSLDRRLLPKATAAFISFLKARRKIPPDASWRWRGHAYLLSDPPRRHVVDAGVLLAGDAAGLAYPQSGEGIRPAIESGLLAASTIIEADGEYDCRRLAGYDARLRARFGAGAVSRVLSRAVPHAVSSALAPVLFDIPWFVRHLLLDRWFLHAHEPALG